VATGEIENGVVQKGFPGGFSGPVFTDTGGAIVFNLYTNPQEDVSIGIRHIPMAVLLQYPPQFKISASRPTILRSTTSSPRSKKG
jgi:hypothetical protein